MRTCWFSCVCLCVCKRVLVSICRAGAGAQNGDGLKTKTVFRPSPHSPVHLTASPQLPPAQLKNTRNTANETRLRFDDPTALSTRSPAGGQAPVHQHTPSAALLCPASPVHPGSVRLENTPHYYYQRAGDRVMSGRVLHAQPTPSSARPPLLAEPGLRHPITQASNSDEVLKLKELCRQQALQAGFWTCARSCWHCASAFLCTPWRLPP